ncbi:hypothetical protein EGR_09429 [Echinococcus granulosus]|uniref:Uncharacterized protein n=1 Tax=Echinococcus granulosus TaxID=6210 RepID=W6U581_ECHGR|nr:hypothetical protein EGR_09429 [Echinococcus granulosus]EUB55716.1 hypothetical protein EGR_09429 [Echinococcus granulosus]
MHSFNKYVEISNTTRILFEHIPLTYLSHTKVEGNLAFCLCTYSAMSLQKKDTMTIDVFSVQNMTFKFFASTSLVPNIVQTPVHILLSRLKSAVNIGDCASLSFARPPTCDFILCNLEGVLFCADVSMHLLLSGINVKHCKKLKQWKRSTKRIYLMLRHAFHPNELCDAASNGTANCRKSHFSHAPWFGQLTAQLEPMQTFVPLCQGVLLFLRKLKRFSLQARLWRFNKNKGYSSFQDDTTQALILRWSQKTCLKYNVHTASAKVANEASEFGRFYMYCTSLFALNIDEDRSNTTLKDIDSLKQVALRRTTKLRLRYGIIIY